MNDDNSGESDSGRINRFTDERREERLLLTSEVDSSSFLFISLTTAVIRVGDLHCYVSMVCNVDC